ncbi:hypothetical protein JI749_12640 [Devosia oryziradicis]|uniref:Uncharacterized protein n=1 Tax=Devosia oryziradicis TaxID=2801335 RepID=A0ABX7BTD1_9HYPH|nr:hypothetical protein [Devosia oryziradicis]QQR35213.1 hypothetical protein JI749_12640 [Devosia oryziradicis]
MTAVVLLLTTASAQAAQHYACADANGEITLAFDYDAAAAEPFGHVEIQLTDDFGISTDPGHEDHSGEFVSAHYAGEDFIGAELRAKDADGKVSGLPAMQIRLVTVSEGANMLVTGGVSVGGGGIWTVTCTVSD